MRLAGYQPQYFPRLHYYNRILTSDIFEISDYVQFVQKHAFSQPDGTMKRGKSFQAHTPIKLSQGSFLLTIPAHDKLLPINQTKISSSTNWMDKHLKSLGVGYRKSQNFQKIFPEIETILKQTYDNLGALTTLSTLWGILRLVTDAPLDISKITPKSMIELLKQTKHPYQLKNIFLASQSPILAPQKGEANDWIIKLCKYAKADEYYFGGTSHNAYMDVEKLKKNGIKGKIQNWKCPEYHQQYMSVGFSPNLSIIDLVMNEDLETRQKIIL